MATWLWLGMVFLAPPALLLTTRAPALPIAAIGLALCLWGLAIRRFRLPPALLLLYPVAIALAIIIASHSLVVTRTGRAKWKDRLIPVAR